MKNRELVYIALFSAIALILYIFETVIPKPFPWLRLGLANLVPLIVLINFGWDKALWVTLIRIFVGSILVGMLFSPIFLLSLLGGIIALATMAITYRFFYPKFSIVGISILGATAHNFTQLLLASLLFVKSWELLYLLPIFCLTSLIMGGFTGVIAYWFQKRFDKLWKPRTS